MNKDHKCNCNNHHGSGGGFIAGALIGAAAVFFLATPKGNKMLKHLMENGFENFSQYFHDEDMDNMGEVVDETLDAVPVQKSPSIKRFFKRKK